VSRLTVLPDARAAAEQAAQVLAHALHEALAQRGVAHLALCGGSTPRPAYESLAGLLDEWSAVELWYGDERCVAPEDPDSTHRLVRESLLDPIAARGLAEPYEHRPRGELGPEVAAEQYAEELRTCIAYADPGGAGGIPILDIALLGIGEDGHTASLFPGHPEMQDASGALCLPVHDSPKPPPERVTLTVPVLRAARHLVLLVVGAAKAEALAAALAAGAAPLAAGAAAHPRGPVSLLVSERLLVVADAAAATRLDSSDSSDIG
jgi:6-phosphogluconolactonase